MLQPLVVEEEAEEDLDLVNGAVAEDAVVAAVDVVVEVAVVDEGVRKATKNGYP
jgi:hypothetical protein